MILPTVPLPGEEAKMMILLATAIASFERAAMVNYVCRSIVVEKSRK